MPKGISERNKRKGKEMPCENCGKLKYYKPSRLAKRTNYFCRVQCQGIWAKKTGARAGENNPRYGEGIIRTCHNCKKSYRTCPTTNRVYCSSKCYTRKGEQGSNWKGGISSTFAKSLKNKIKCEQCGSKKKLHIHHKDHNRKNNVIENIAILCSKCHIGYHNKNRHVHK